jgi:hypothetical protein
MNKDILDALRENGSPLSLKAVEVIEALHMALDRDQDFERQRLLDEVLSWREIGQSLYDLHVSLYHSYECTDDCEDACARVLRRKFDEILGKDRWQFLLRESQPQRGMYYAHVAEMRREIERLKVALAGKDVGHG